jgi:hypothetical protein
LVGLVPRNIKLHVLEHCVKLVSSNFPSTVFINSTEHVAQALLGCTQALIDQIEVLLLEFECVLSDRDILAHILLPCLILELNLILLEDPQEPFKVNSHVLIAPKLVHKVVEFSLIDFQCGALKEISEVFFSDEASAALVSN